METMTIAVVGIDEALASMLEAVAGVRRLTTLAEMQANQDACGIILVADRADMPDRWEAIPRVIVLTPDESLAEAALEAGAWDVVLAGPAAGVLLRRKAEQAVEKTRLVTAERLAQDELQAVLDSAADGIITISDRGMIQSFNAAAEDIFGWKAEEVIGRNVSCLMPSHIGAEHDMYMSRYMDGGVPRIIGMGREVMGQRKDGSHFPLHLAVSDVEVRGRRFFTGIVSDLSELRAAQKQAEEREALLSAVLNDTPDPIFAKDLDGRYLIANAACCAVFGRRPEEVIGWTDREMLPGQVETVQSADAEVMQSGQTQLLQETLDTASGVRTYSVTKSPLTNSRGKVVGLVGVARDVTDVLRTQRELEERNRLLAMTEEVARVGHWYLEADGEGLTWSSQVYRIHGLSPDAPLPDVAAATRCYVEEDQQRVQEAVRDAILEARGISLEARLCRADGELRDVLVKATPDFDQGGEFRGLLGILHDITDLRRAQTEAAATADLLHQSVEALQEAFVLYDDEERLVVCNEAYIALLGGFVRPGMTFSEILHEGLRQDRFCEAQGREDDWLAERLADFRKGGTQEVQVGGGWFLATDLHLPNGYVVGTRVDVTDLREAREEANRANRAKSDFLSSMSHELRTPMNAILGFAQLLAQGRKDPLTERQAGQVRQILKGGQHLLNLINEILDLARIEAGHLLMSLEPVETRALLEDCQEITSRLAEASGIVIADQTRGQDLPWLHADQTRAKQILLNLLSNAVKYNKPGGTVRVQAGVEGDGKLRISVTDTGHGIPASRQAELFQPFSRLGQELGEVEGTGIGLTITRKLAREMGGDVGFTSVEGEGSTFWVCLPTSGQLKDNRGASARDERRQETAGDGDVILYVEDNAANRELMEEIIEDLVGYRLITAANGEEGIQMAVQDQPDIILMDINLPGMDGFKCLELLRQQPLTRHIPVIALSANAMPSTIRRGIAAGFASYLTKPLQLEALEEALEAVRLSSGQGSEAAPDTASPIVS